AGHHRAAGLGGPGAAAPSRGTGQPRPSPAADRRRGYDPGRRRDHGGSGLRAVRLQSRPRRASEDTTRTCRRADPPPAWEQGMSRRIAVVLFNLGGPDNPDAIRPFLFNLFADPAIIRVPNPVRAILAWAIAKKRTRQAKAIYAEIGGGSPLLPNTEAQALALQAALADLGEVKVFVAM